MPETIFHQTANLPATPAAEAPSDPANTVPAVPQNQPLPSIAYTGTGTVGVNTAELDQLLTLPGVGTATAKKIVANRPYSNVEDLIARIAGVEWLSLLDHINCNPVPEVSGISDKSTNQPETNA